MSVNNVTLFWAAPLSACDYFTEDGQEDAVLKLRTLFDNFSLHDNLIAGQSLGKPQKINGR